MNKKIQTRTTTMGMQILHWSTRVVALMFTAMFLFYLPQFLQLEAGFVTALLNVVPLFVLAFFLVFRFPLLSFIAYITAGMTYGIQVPSCIIAFTHLCFWPIQGVIIIGSFVLLDGVLHRSTYRS